MPYMYQKQTVKAAPRDHFYRNVPLNSKIPPDTQVKYSKILE